MAVPENTSGPLQLRSTTATDAVGISPVLLAAITAAIQRQTVGAGPVRFGVGLVNV